jgi:NAD-dependent deacetylase
VCIVLLADRLTRWLTCFTLFALALLPSTHPMQPVRATSISGELRRRFLNAGRVLVLTGAGISAESGVPTFRGGGNTLVWKGMPFDVISSARMVEQDLPAVWEWFDYRRGLLQALNPNPAHYEIAKWQDHFLEFTLVTQNIDGLHQKAGSRDVIELHGSIWRVRCVSCHARFEISPSQPREDACPDCGDPVRPDVVLFGEILPPGAFEQAATAAANSELCFVIGTSALVYPAAGLPEIARAAGAFVCEVNPERTPLSDVCDELLMGKAGEVLPLFSKLG